MQNYNIFLNYANFVSSNKIFYVLNRKRTAQILWTALTIMKQ